jgi:anti-sigma regulatory factor (Ser/Thr protein kinase)
MRKNLSRFIRRRWGIGWVMTLTWTRELAAVPTAVPQLRHELVEFARTAGADNATCDDLALTVSEAAGNVVRHAYPDGGSGAIHAEASIDRGEHLSVQIGDRGRGIAAGALSGRGFGFGLMAELSDQLCVEDGADGVGTIVTLRFALSNARGGPRLIAADTR